MASCNKLLYYFFFPFSESANSSASDIEYFNGDSSLPLLTRRSRVWTSSVKAILDTPKKFIRTKHPTQININCAFVVDTSKLDSSGDTKCDDCGAWRQTKTATTHLRICFDTDGAVSSVKCSTKGKRKKCYALVRRHYRYVSSPDLTRHIAMLLDLSGQEIPFQYPIEAKPHGNATKLRPYKRTCPSTLNAL